MAWQDRPYYRDRDSSAGNPLLWLLSGSLPLFTAFGIRVRMHASLAVLIALELIFAATPIGMGFANALTFGIVLFSIILLHEYGHCFAARMVGGSAEDILLWPLGGLAYADAPNRPFPQLVTAVGGPMVNVIICLVTALFAWIIERHHPAIQLNPLTGEFHVPAILTIGFYLWWIFGISWGLLLFNLLPAFPLDGGRILQTLLWFRLGQYSATLIACTVGMVAWVVLGLFGLYSFGSWYSILFICLAISCFIYCYQLRAQTKAQGPWAFEDEGTDFSAGLWQPDKPSRKRRRLSDRAVRKLRKQAQNEAAEQAHIDAILAKVSAHGMQSLTWSERRALHKATARQRRRELELSPDRE